MLRPLIAPTESTEASGKALGDFRDFLTGVDRVDMQAVDRQPAREVEVVLQLAEVGCEQHAHAARGERIVGGDECVAPFASSSVTSAGSSICTHSTPCAAKWSSSAAYTGRRRGSSASLSESSFALPSHRYVTGPMMTGLAFTPSARASPSCSMRRVGSSLNCVVRVELGDDVVIVGIEPLGHFASRDAAAARGVIVGALGRASARDAEIVVERIAMKIAHALGQVAEREAHVEHLIVEREVADGREVEPRLIFPMPLAQLRAERLQLVA